MIEELLIALSGFPGDLFYPAPTETATREGLGWRMAPELVDILHPGEEQILLKLLALPAYVSDLEDFVSTYGSLALFRCINTATATSVGHQSNSGASSDCESGLTFPNVAVSPLFGSYACSLTEGFATILEKYRSHLVDLEDAFCKWRDGENFQRPSNALSLIYADLQPYFRIFPALHRLLELLSSDPAKLGNGGEIVGVVCRVYESERADHVVEKEMKTLLRRCLTPFRNHLTRWLATGALDSDRFGEFFIRMTNNGEVMVREEYRPPFVNRAVGEKILFVGKSVKLMLDSSLKSGLEDWENQLAPVDALFRLFSTHNEPLNFNYDDLRSELEKRMEIVRRAAAEKLYSYCFEETNAKKALTAWVKNAFLLGKGELFLALVDTGEATLAAPLPTDHMENQSMLLTNVWAAAVDKIYWLDEEEREYFSKITPYFAADPLVEKPTGWDWINLRLDPPQRLRPLFTPEFLSNLNIIFRFLLRWRRTQCLLESCWVNLKKWPGDVSLSLPSLGKIHQLVALMLFVVKHFQYYVQADVVETVYARVVDELASCRDFERVLNLLQVDLVEHIYLHCFLKREGASGDGWRVTVGKLLREFRKDCDSFSSLLLARVKQTRTPISTPTTPVENDRTFATRLHDAYVKFQRNTALLFKILTSSKIHDNSGFLNHLLLRLDFNEYFSSTQMFSS